MIARKLNKRIFAHHFLTLSLAFLLCSIISCERKADRDPSEILYESLRVYGQENLMNAKLSFIFRDRRYTATRTTDNYTYTRTWQENDTTVISDRLVNSKIFSRVINGKQVTVPDSMAEKYSNSINSVLYFIQLPYLLKDQAVKLSYKGETQIQEEWYEVVGVTFEQQQGGDDYEDEYLYWFHRDTHMIDYLAYNYQTDGGGVRFRKAYNRDVGKYIIVQDYINYEVPLGTPLDEIPEMYQNDQLNELSRIVNQDVSLTPIN